MPTSDHNVQLEVRRSMLESIALENQSPRMQPLSRLPVFFALEGKRAVDPGGTASAAWKVELLSPRARPLCLCARAVR